MSLLYFHICSLIIEIFYYSKFSHSVTQLAFLLEFLVRESIEFLVKFYSVGNYGPQFFVVIDNLVCQSVTIGILLSANHCNMQYALNSMNNLRIFFCMNSLPRGA